MTRIRALARGLQVLDLFLVAERASGAPRSLSVADIAAQLGIDKSGASRTAATLADQGYLQRDPVSRRYQLGAKLRSGTPPRDGVQALKAYAHPFLVALMKRTAECAHVAIHADGRALIVDDVESDATTLKVTAEIGRSMLMHCTAVGKALLAFADLPVPELLPRRTDRTLVDPDELTADLARTRRLGYAFDDVENEPGVRCLAAPVREAGGRTVACIGISGPTVRIPLDRVPELAETVMASARELSAALGYEAAAPAQEVTP